MAILHFALTAPKWSLSLFLFLAASQVPLPTTQEAIDKPLHRLQTLLTMESQSYENCATNAHTLLEQELENAIRMEAERSQEYQETNDDRIHESQMRVDRCINSTNTALALLRQWQDDGNEISWEISNTTCSEDEKNYLNDIMGAEFRVLETEMNSLLEGYVDDTLDMLHLMASYAEERFQYDYNYFLESRIQPALDMINTFPQLEQVGFSIDHDVIERRMRRSFDQIELAMTQTKKYIDALQSRIEKFTRSINSFYEAYEDAYNRLLKGALFIEDFLPPGVPLPAFLNIDTLPIGASLRPSDMDVAILGGDFLSTQHLIEDATSQCLEILHDVVADLQTQADLRLRDATDYLVTELSTTLSLEDYNPPLFAGSIGTNSALHNEVEFQTQKGQEVLKGAKRLVERLQLADQASSSELGTNVSLESSGDTTLPERTTFDYFRPTFPMPPFPDLLMVLLSWISANTWVLEILVQLARLWRLEAMYNRGAVPDRPEINYGEADEQSRQSANLQWITTMLLKVFLSPRMCYMIALVTLFAVANIAWYPHVKASCVDTSNGTYVANQFLAPILINEASVLGNLKYVKAETHCQRVAGRACANLQGHANAQYNVDTSKLESLRTQHQREINIISSSKRCLARNTSSLITLSCCGLKGYEACDGLPDNAICPMRHEGTPIGAYRPLHELLSDDACEDMQIGEGLLGFEADCELVMETCSSIPCGGVNEAAIKKETIRTDCEVELYAVSLSLFLIAAVYHAIVVNFICNVLFSGIRQLYWRELCPGGIRFSSRLHEDGRLARGTDKEERLARVGAAIKRFEIAGRLKIAVSCTVGLCWAVSLAAYRNG